MIVIGIVGPPAGGKSTVAAMLADQGAAWINADRLAHAALRLNDVKEKLRKRFGLRIFDAHGAVDRSRLAAEVFGDDPTSKRALEYIESVLHPIAHQAASRKLQRFRKQAALAVVIDAPLLIEANWHFECDEIWYIEASWELRSQWIAKRSWTPEQLRQRESRQMPLAEKKRHATRIIDNTADTNHTEQQVIAAWKQMIQPTVITN